MKEIRTRMAPSPTGEYHIGHIRTVLYNYALAKKYHGKFILRIEDTDRERLIPDAMDKILDVIKDYHLSWDEGPRVGGPYEPYIQSERLSLYQKYAHELVGKGKAYYCFCTPERLTQMREEQLKQHLPKTMYDGHCRNLPEKVIKELLDSKTPYVIRLKVPRDYKVKFTDQVYGELEFDSNEIDDSVLLKSDGFPTYHLAVVVDDHLMKITHIMRGNDWLPSTPKHVLLYEFFGWGMPIMIHLPNLKEKGENRKLSKRYGSVFAIEFLKEGYLVDALLNFLMLLGWNPGLDREVYSLDEFINEFDIKRIHKTDLVSFDREKLLWMNGYYIRNMSVEKLWEILNDWSKKYEVDLHNHLSPDLSVVKNKNFSSVDLEKYHISVLSLVHDRIKKLADYIPLTHYFYQPPSLEKEKINLFTKDEKRTIEILNGFYKLFTEISQEENFQWIPTTLEKIAHDFINKNNYKTKEAFMTLRLVITGEEATPPIFEILALLGQDEVLQRIRLSLV